MDEKSKTDTISAVGISSLIIFIAMIIVVAVAASSLIILFEKTFQDSAAKADRMDYASNGKVAINNIYVYRYEPCWMSTSTNENCPSNWGHHQLITPTKYK